MQGPDVIHLDDKETAGTNGENPRTLQTSLLCSHPKKRRENQSLRLVRTEQNAQLSCSGQIVITKNDQVKSLPTTYPHYRL